jgi:hypothetical protein
VDEMFQKGRLSIRLLYSNGFDTFDEFFNSLSLMLFLTSFEEFGDDEEEDE